MYCDGKDSLTRNSSVTALKIILKTLASLLAPVLSFTAEEVWKEAGFSESVFLEPFPNLDEYRNPALEEKFSSLLEAKEDIQKALELARQSAKIGKSLEAKVILEPLNGKNTLAAFTSEDLEFYLVVSQVAIGEDSLKKNETEAAFSTLDGNHYKIRITSPSTESCPRCWRHSLDIQSNGLCKRCDLVVSV
jgi:isoleucyl-tRNA synthetase